MDWTIHHSKDVIFHHIAQCRHSAHSFGLSGIPDLVFIEKLPSVPLFLPSSPILCDQGRWITCDALCKMKMQGSFFKNYEDFQDGDSGEFPHVRACWAQSSVWLQRSHSCNAGPTYDFGRVASHGVTSLCRMVPNYPGVVIHDTSLPWLLLPESFQGNHIWTKQRERERALFPLGWVIYWTNIHWVPTVCQALCYMLEMQWGARQHG